MTLSTLGRYSKPRGAGDQTSGGRGKLLRPTSDLSRVGIVVRETLQNKGPRLGSSLWSTRLQGERRCSQDSA